MNIVYILDASKKGSRVTATSARYRVTAFAISLAALAYVQRVAISQAAEGIQADLQLGKAELGLIFGAFLLSYALLEISNGLLGDRFGVRRTLTYIVVAWSASTALTGDCNVLLYLMAGASILAATCWMFLEEGATDALHRRRDA
jgi:sugar phosphate permease